MALPSGWWYLTRGGVVDRTELFSQTMVSTGKIGNVSTAIGVGDSHRGAWELGPYKLGPEDSPLSITGVFTAAGAMAKEKPRFALNAYLFDEQGTQVWNGKSRISSAVARSDADLSMTDLTLGMVPIATRGEYMLYCNTNEEAAGMAGIGTGAMQLDMVIRKQAKSFPVIPVGVGFVILLVAIFGFGESPQASKKKS